LYSKKSTGGSLAVVLYDFVHMEKQDFKKTANVSWAVKNDSIFYLSAIIS
jgi:hypothetical protein